MKKILYIVMPAYNEEEIIESSVNLVTEQLKCLIKNKKIGNTSKIVVVDDGSIDRTLEILKGMVIKNKYLEVREFSKIKLTI